MGFFKAFKKQDGKPAAAAAKPATAPAHSAKAGSRAPYLSGIVLRRLVTEKAAAGAARSQYVFEVAPDANKITIKRALQQRYGAAPEKVRVVNVRGRGMRFGRTQGKTKAWKKAIATFPASAKIDAEKTAA
ncbi:MAG: 50S ribosomal protein L23 [bacterium]|nr:50S ribosomal protein L23 [bacterium]